MAFKGGALQLIQSVTDGLTDKKACVIGSGDNMAAFALAGLGAQVTSTDISEERLAMGSRRAEQIGLSISFVRSDAACQESLADSSFDLVCSTNDFFVWIADLEAVFGEVARILRPGGSYVYFDVHPFQRPWKDQAIPIEMGKPYWSTGPFQPRGSDSYEFNWTLADLLNPMAAAGLMLVKLLESPARDTRYWQVASHWDVGDEALLDWTKIPGLDSPYGWRLRSASQFSEVGKRRIAARYWATALVAPWPSATPRWYEAFARRHNVVGNAIVNDNRRAKHE